MNKLGLPIEVELQACGCISPPDEVARSLGIGPGSTLSLSADVGYRTVTLRAISPEIQPDSLADRAACPLPSARA